MKKFFKKAGLAAGKVADAVGDAIDDLRETDEEAELREAVELIQEKYKMNDGPCPFCGADRDQHFEGGE